jgi:hypothetical protein
MSHRSADGVKGGFALECGHFLAEEQPYEIASQLRDWLTG